MNLMSYLRLRKITYFIKKSKDCLECFFNLLLVIIILTGGITIANAQEKPPLLRTSSSPIQTQTPLPISGTVPPPPPAPVSGLQPSPPVLLSSTIIKDIQVSAFTAVSTAIKAKVYLTPGRIWTMTGSRGEVDVKAAVIYDGIVVLLLYFNPLDGSLLPLGIHSTASVVTPQI